MKDQTSRRLRAVQAAILAGAAGLIALIWFDTAGVVGAERKVALDRTSVLAQSRAMAFAAALDRQLAAADQTLRVMTQLWRRDPAGFNLTDWRRYASLLDDGSAMFRTDPHGVIVQASADRLVGDDIAATEPFREATEALPGEDQLHVGRAALESVAQGWQVPLLRALRDADGRFVGTIGIMDRTWSLTADFIVADLGPTSLAAVIGTDDGRVRATLGPAAGQPDISMTESGLFKALQHAVSGTWTGIAKPRGVDRVWGFQRTTSQPLTVAVGIECSQALTTAIKPTRAARHFAFGITGLVVLIAVVLLLELRLALWRERRLAADQKLLAEANAGLRAARRYADANTARLQAVLSGMADGVLMLDAELRVVAWNQQFAELTGIPPGVLRPGLSLHNVLRAQVKAGEFGRVDPEVEVARRVALLRAGISVGTLQRTRPDGRVIELHRNRLPNGGYVTLASDITERKHAEDALRHARAVAEAATAGKARFAAMVSHEIRAPLLALLNSLDLLAEAPPGASQPDLLTAARCSNEALLGLVDDILDLSRIETGHLTLRPAAFLLRPLLDGAVDMLRPQAAGRGLRLCLSIAEAVPPMWTADPGRLRQVLVNLLSNAVKYSGPGEILIRAEMRHGGALSWLQLSVTDPGPAISPDLRARLFEPFSEPGPGSGRGNGLGLAICRSLIASMGGEIGCETTPSNGNCFWIAVPDLQAPGFANPLPADRAVPRTRILLVEDMAASRLATALLLRRAGHKLTCVADGGAALRELDRTPYDLVLLDMHLPDMCGIDLIERARVMSGPGRVVPVLGLTADCSAEDVDAALSAGMRAVLRKGLSSAQWRDAVLRHVWRATGMVTTEPPVDRRDRPVVDAARLADLRATIRPDALGGLIEECLTELYTLLDEATRAEAAGSNDQLEAVLHAMAGLAANYGLDALAQHVRQSRPIEEIAVELARAAAAMRGIATTAPPPAVAA